MTTATWARPALKVGDFAVEYLGVDYPDYFQGYGLGPNSKYDFCAYGIGDTEEEALADCLDQVAQQGFDLDEETEECVRADYGRCDDSTTAAEYLDCEEDSESAYYHVGMKWNCRQEQRLERLRKIPNLQFLCYEDYCALPGVAERDLGEWRKVWGDVTRADGDVSYGDLKDADCPESAEKYLGALLEDVTQSGELYFYVPYTTGSDYAGDTITASNHKEFIGAYGANEWVFSAHGNFSTYAAVVGLTGLLECAEDTFDKVCNVLEGLEDCPFIDEEAHSQLEMEKTDEAWKWSYAADFRDALEKKFGGAEFAWPSDDKLRVFFEAQRGKANEEWFNEGSGADMCVRFDRIVEGINLDDLDAWVIRYAVVSFNDCGAVIERYNRESDASKRVATLRATGFDGAFYSIVEPPTPVQEDIVDSIRAGLASGEK